MDNPNFIRKFCIIGLGNTEELKEDLTVISETSVNFVSGEGLIIATFESAFALPEIEELLNMSNRSYIIFEMTMGFYSANIENKEFQNALFGGDISSSNTSYNMMLEAIKKVREGLFFTPDQVSDILNVKESKKSDEELLQEALDNEDYETAAKLRDKLNSKD
jgi:protein-arginine kinase activator protein McsA